MVTGIGTPMANAVIPDWQAFPWLSLAVPGQLRSVSTAHQLYHPFSVPIDPTSLQASDLTVNSIAANYVSLSADDLTATFSYTTSPITAWGRRRCRWPRRRHPFERPDRPHGILRELCLLADATAYHDQGHRPSQLGLRSDGHFHGNHHSRQPRRPGYLVVHRLRAVCRRRFETWLKRSPGQWDASVTTSSISAGTHSVYAMFESSKSKSFRIVRLQRIPSCDSRAPDHHRRQPDEDYGTPNPALTCTYSGFVNGETVTNLPVQPSVATTATTPARSARIPSSLRSRVRPKLHRHLHQRHADRHPSRPDDHGQQPDDDLRGTRSGVDRFVQRVHQRRLDQQRDPIGPHALHSGCGQ